MVSMKYTRQNIPIRISRRLYAKVKAVAKQEKRSAAAQLDEIVEFYFQYNPIRAKTEVVASKEG